jgi:diguanylate cyclase (GGDEF)-like protein
LLPLSGILLTGAWTQMRGEPALLWWAAAKFALAVGVGLLSYGAATSSVVMLAIGGLVTAVAPALLWAGTRTFVGRRISRLFLLSGTIIWFIAAGIPFRGGPQEATTIVGFAAWIAYLTATNWELWRARAERLTARWPLMALLTLHGVIFVGGIYDIVFHQMLAQAEPPINSWFGLIYFEGIVYAVGSAIFMIVMSHERSEGSHIRAAQTDALTGVAGRGAFFLGAERLLARCRTENIPISVVVFDLDRFKSINDKHGHAMGDRVLRIFADTARGVLRPDDFLGRHGGEEFAVVLPGTSLDAAYVVADRVRSTRRAKVDRALINYYFESKAKLFAAAIAPRISVQRLIYGAAGLAYADVDNRLLVTNGGLSADLRRNGLEGGVTVGGGVEYALNSSWSLKAEYQYVSLGSDTLSAPVAPPNGIVVSSNKIENSFQAVLIGFNYKFGSSGH